MTFHVDVQCLRFTLCIYIQKRMYCDLGTSIVLVHVRPIRDNLSRFFSFLSFFPEGYINHLRERPAKAYVPYETLLWHVRFILLLCNIDVSGTAWEAGELLQAGSASSRIWRKRAGWILTSSDSAPPAHLIISSLCLPCSRCLSPAPVHQWLSCQSPSAFWKTPSLWEKKKKKKPYKFHVVRGGPPDGIYSTWWL